jgi:hypothetical protein
VARVDRLPGDDEMSAPDSRTPVSFVSFDGAVDVGPETVAVPPEMWTWRLST